MPVISNTLKRRGGAWIEVFAGGESIRLPIELAYGLTPGTELENASWLRLKAESEYQLLYDYALRALGRREHFAEQLRRKLAQRTFDRQLIGRVLEACRQRGYLDNARAADYVATQLLQRGGIGRMRLKAELFARGCPADLIDTTIARHAGGLDEGAAAAELLARNRARFTVRRDKLRGKLEEKPGVNPRKIRMLLRGKLGLAVSGLLRQRGFSGDEVNRAGRRLVDELMEELDS